VIRQCLLGGPGLVARGHEFHYSEIVETGSTSNFDFAYELRRRKDEPVRLEGYQSGSVLASYIHLHWGSAPDAAAGFVSRCAEWTKGSLSK
jgi:cobyrinic acid a,c-diamide synthase